MADPKEGNGVDQNAEHRRDETLRRMLNTPSQRKDPKKDDSEKLESK